MSYGRVSLVLSDGSRASTAAMKVFNFSGGVAVPGGAAQFRRLSVGDYPARYFQPTDYLSFTAVANAGGTFGANSTVSFTGADDPRDGAVRNPYGERRLQRQ